MRICKCYGHKLLLKELKGSYNFFIKEANVKTGSKGYGLIKDKTKLADNVSSITSVGYGLAALIIGVEHNWISYKKAFDRANKTLDTFIQNIESINGFFYHFVDINTGKRVWNCEVSIIDTAIFICGAITAGEYFGGDIKDKAEYLYKRINWRWYTNPNTNQFYMGYSKEKGFWGAWDMYAEQLMQYVLGVSSPTFSVAPDIYDSFSKEKKDYKQIKDIIYTYGGTLFTYQFSHAWIDFKDKKDLNGIDWFENSVKATKANRQFCIDNKDKFKTFGEDSWGLTACSGPDGYSGEYGAKPCGDKKILNNDGTIPPCGAIGSIVFTPEESMKAMEYYYNNFPKLWCEYGFKDAYNLEGKKAWYSIECIGIDKGISMIMIENYLSSLIWKNFMKNKYVKKGLNLLQIKDKNMVHICDTEDGYLRNDGNFSKKNMKV